jgi:hypothetical protein
MPTHPLWSQISPVLANDILLHTQKNNKKLYRTAVDIVAPNIGLRSVKIMEMPKVERHGNFTRLLAHPQLEALSFNILSTWLVDNHAPMLCAWLNALGVAHDELGCASSFPADPGKAKLTAAIDTLLKQFDATNVTIYLNAFNEIDDVHWASLAEILTSDARLKIASKAAPVTEAPKTAATA